MGRFPQKVAVASRSFSRHPVLRAELAARVPEVTFNDGGASLNGQGLIDFLAGHDAVITALERVDATILSALPQLRILSKYGVGLDMIDLPALRRADVHFGWTGGVNRRSVAELVIAGAISLLRRIPEANAEVRDGLWRQVVGRLLSDRVVGIVGCGHVGKDLTPLLQAFGCTILAHDIRDFPEFYARHRVQAVGLEELLTRADVITLHLPLDASTAGILSAERLALMRPDAILVNAARGGLIDEAALLAMLKDGRLAGAMLDVLDDEPPQDLELLRLPNVLVTPHIGGSAEEAILAMGRAAIEGLFTAELPAPGSESWRAAGAGL